MNLLQRAGGAGAGAGAPGKLGDLEMAMIFGILGVICLVLLIFFVIHIFFTLNISKTLKLVSSRNRKMEPGMVWLMFVPLLGYVWIFMVVLKTAESLDEEFYDRRLRSEGDFGKTIGLIWAICSVVAAFLSLCSPLLGILPGVPAFICYIMYWIKMSGYRKQLEGNSKYSSRDEVEEDEERKPRRRQRDDDDQDEDEDDSSRRRS
ncbi:MAG: hypothetical protein ACRC8S_18255 [Fimbriiglobus sp.]